MSWGPKSPSGCPSGKGLSYRGLGSWDEIPEAKAKMLNCYSDLSLGRDGGSVSLFRGLVSLFRMEQFICHHKSRRLAQNCGGRGKGLLSKRPQPETATGYSHPVPLFQNFFGLALPAPNNVQNMLSCLLLIIFILLFVLFLQYMHHALLW